MKPVVFKTVFALTAMVIVGVALFIIFPQSSTGPGNRPSRLVLPLNLETVESQYSVKIKAQHAPLQETSRESLSRIFRDDTGEPEACTRNGSGAEICRAVGSDIVVVSEKVSLGLVADNAFYVTVLFNITGEIIKPDESDENFPFPFITETFSAKVKTYSKVMLSIDSGWCLGSTVSPNFKWIQGGDIKYDGIRIKLKNHLESRMTKLLEEMAQGVVATIQCGDIREQVQQVWRTRSIPLAIPDNTQPQYIHIKPTSIGYSNLKLESGHVLFDLNVFAKTDISTKAIASQSPPVPRSKLLRHKARTIDLSLFFQIPYRRLENELSSQLIGATLISRTRFGTFSLSVKSIEVYPVKDLLAVGMLVESDNSEEWFSKSGWVYLLARPVGNLESGDVLLSFQRFAAGMDQGLSLAIKELVVPKIEQTVPANFKKQVDSTGSAITKVFEHENMIDEMAAPVVNIKRAIVTGNSVLIEIVYGFMADLQTEQKKMEQGQPDSPVDSTMIEPIILYDLPDVPE